MVIDWSNGFDEGASTSYHVDEKHLLAALLHINQLTIMQTSGVNMPIFKRNLNRFEVANKTNNILYTVEEDSSWWNTYCCYRLRPCQLRVFDTKEVEVIRIQRPFACSPRLLPCQLQQMTVFFPPHAASIGTIQQQRSLLRPLYKVVDQNGTDIFFLKGPILTMSNIVTDVQFSVQDRHGSPAAKINKKSFDVERYMLAPMPTTFKLKFMKSMQVEHKAILIALTILIHYMYFD